MNGGTVSCKGSTCVCPDEYVGTYCEKLRCAEFSCLNGGTCNTAGICQCQATYVGLKCEACKIIIILF